MHSMRSARRQVELRRLGNQLPVLGKANSLCEVGNIPLQFDRDMYLLVKVCVFCLFVKLRLSPGCIGPGKNISRDIVARTKSV